MDRSAPADNATTEFLAVDSRVPVPGPLFGLLLITPVPERTGNDLHRSIGLIPEAIAMDIVSANGTLQVRVRVDDAAHMQRIGDRFRRQAAVVGVTETILGPDPAAATCPPYPAL